MQVSYIHANHKTLGVFVKIAKYVLLNFFAKAEFHYYSQDLILTENHAENEADCCRTRSLKFNLIAK